MKNSTGIKKNIAILIGVLIFSIGTTACSKAYNCHCVYKTNGVIDHEDDKQINEGKKSKSEASCKQGNTSTTSTLNNNTYVSTTECALTN